MKKKGTYHLHVKELNQWPKRITFDSKNSRTMYLIAERNRAIFQKLQYTYKRGEYLRIYRGPITFVEYDIKGDRKAQAEMDWNALR